MSAPAPSLTLTFDLEHLKRAIQALPAEQRAALRWAPVALEALLRRLLDADSLSQTLCDDAALAYTQVISQLFHVFTTLAPDPQTLSAFFSEVRESAFAPLDLALPWFAPSDVISEARALWMRDIMQASAPYDLQILGVVVPALRPPSQAQPPAPPPNLTASLCLDALALGIRERAPSLRLHDLMAQAIASFSQWVEAGPSLEARLSQLADAADDPSERQDALRVLAVHRQRQAVLVPYQHALTALEEAGALAEAAQWADAAQRLAQEDLAAPASAALAALRARLTSGRALPFVSRRLHHPMPTFKQVGEALALAPPDGRWVAVHADGSFESAPTLRALRDALGQRYTQMLFVDRGRPRDTSPP